MEKDTVPETAPAKTMLTSAQKLAEIEKIQQTETKKSLFTRQWLLGSLLALYLCIGVPLWFKFTEIYRAPLPSNFISALAQHNNIDIKLTNDIYFNVGDRLKYPDIAEAAQIQVDHLLHEMHNNPEDPMLVQWGVNFKQEEKIPEDAYVLNLQLGDREGISVEENSKETVLFYTLESVKNNDLPFFVTQTVLFHVFKTEIDLLKANRDRGINAIKYSPNVHLSFKLLTGDGFPVDWEIDQALKAFFTPLVEEFKGFVNFTIDTEVKYFTELNLPSDSNKISSSDLSTILDFSEWDVSSNPFPYPTLNFMLYFPSKNQSPLEFTEESQYSTNKAFLIPQWGSVILESEPLASDTVLSQDSLRPILETFTSELFKLMGIPRHPKAPKIRIDAMKKATIIDNLNRAVDSLQSLLKLSKSLPNISIPKTVLHNVKLALSYRESVVEKINNSSDFNGALLDSVKMLQHAEQAFFDPEMVQQTFFPQEHKVAVYMPLIGPLSLIMILGSVRVLKEYKLYKKKRE